MRVAWISLLTLAACSVAHPLSNFDKRGSKQVAGFSFDVSWNNSAAEATRTNIYWKRDMIPVWAAAQIAVEDLTGCAVRKDSLGGDIALVTMKLTCPDAPSQPPKSETSTCTGVATEVFGNSGDLLVDFTCSPDT